MPIRIHITDKVAGVGTAYTKKNKHGDKIEVNLYEMTVNDAYHFKVARDTQSNRPPCPPNKKDAPYKGRVRTDGDLGFRVEIYEEGLASNQYTLRGQGDEVRTNIQIHMGPGYSEGCFLLTDDEIGRNEFQKIIESYNQDDIEVWVE